MAELKGTHLDIGVEATPDLVGAGDAELSATREQIHRNSIRSSAKIQRDFAEIADRAQERAGAAMKQDGTSMTVKGQSAYRGAMHRELDAAIRKVDSDIRSGVDATVQRGLDAQARRLKKLGANVPSAAEMEDIRQSTVSTFGSRYPKGPKGQTYEQRIQRIRIHHKNQQAGASRIRSPRGMAEKMIARRAQRGLAGSGDVRVEGGTAVNKLRRLQVAEETRAANAAELKLLKASGIELAHWRLNAAHKWYGGTEICEVHAAEIDEDVRSYLEALGIDASESELAGLKFVRRWPGYPHPFCKCFMDAWYPKEFSRLLDDPVMTSPTVMDAESTAAATSLNAIASEALGTPAYSVSDVVALGPKGSAQALAQKLRSAGKQESTLASLRKHLSEEVPKAEKRMAQVRETIQKEISMVRDDVLLSSTTRATQAAKLQAELQREVTQAMANLDAMLALEAELASSGTAGRLISNAFSSRRVLAQKMRMVGLGPKDYEVTKVGRGFRASIPKDSKKLISDTVVAGEKRRAIESIKKLEREFPMTHSRTILDEFPPGHKFRKFTLDKGQQAGALMIEEQEQVLLHFAPGVGKTPLATASVNDLASKGKISRALVSPPRSVREQFVQEILKFSPDDVKVQLFVPKTQIERTRRALESGIRKELQYNSSLSSEAIESIVRGRSSRIRIDAIPRGANAADEMAAVLRSSRSRFVVAGHDDVASFAGQFSNAVDYAAVDEIHQLTSAVSGVGSKRAQGLQALTGGRIKYKVALTGTAARNNVGELHDIATWLRPGVLPTKEEYLALYDAITLRSNALQNSVLKGFRSQIDDFTFTLESTVKADLKNFLNDEANKLRKLALSQEQREAVRRVEQRFAVYKQRQKALDAVGKNKLQLELDRSRRELRELLAEYSITDAQSAKILSLPKPIRDKIKALSARADDANKVLSPESWRDSQHFKIVHSLFPKSNEKIQETARLVRGELRGQKPIIHVEQLDSAAALREELSELRVAVYSGDMGMAERKALVDAYNAGEFDALVVTRAGSTGLNLQRASTATIHYDTPYTMAEYLQREARNWRKGQGKDVSSFLLHQEDHFTDRRRLKILKNKGKVLSAIDELSKLDDTIEHRLLQQVATRKDMMTYERLVETGGRTRAEEFLRSLCATLEETGETCPFRGIPGSKALQRKPILAQANDVERKKIIDANPRAGKRAP